MYISVRNEILIYRIKRSFPKSIMSGAIYMGAGFLHLRKTHGV